MSRIYRLLESPRHPPRWAGRLVLAQDDWGDLWVASIQRPDWWDRRFTPRNPSHWPSFVLSWLTGWFAMIEAV